MAELFSLPDTVLRHKLSNKHGFVADTTYRLNSFGIRDDINVDQPKKRHLLFSGCSFTFGDNIPYEDSYPAILRSLIPDANVRNLGFPGGGLHTALRHFEVSDFKDFVPEKKGIYFYVYINDHFSRWVRNVGFLRWAGESTPTYDYVNGKIAYAGQVKDQPDYKKYQSFKSLGIALPETGPLIVKIKPDKVKMKSFMDGIVLLKERYLKKYPDGRFIWLIHPYIHLIPVMKERFRLSAEKRGIEIHFGNPDYEEFLKASNIARDRHMVKWDGHPNGEFNKWFAEWLKKKFP